MPITLTLTAPGEPLAQSDYTFDADRVVIGRGGEATLVLPDTKRVVSKEHAAVVQGDGGYSLVDLGSKNLTYLKGEPLEAHRPYVLQDGDTFSIGEFTLRCTVRVTLLGADQTVFDGDFLNPFLEDAAVLAATLRSMAKTYDLEPTARRDDALLDAVRTAAEQSQGVASPVLRLIASAFGGTVGALGLATTPLAPRQAAPPEAGPASGSMLEAMARALARVLAIPQRFRHEFIGQTIVQGPEASPIYGGDAQALQHHLLQAGLDPEEVERRAQRLQEAADTLALHHIAILDGYRASVREGAAHLLDAVDPTPEPTPGGFMAKVFPARRRARAADEAAARWRGLREEDWAVAERRVFRPAFIKAYLQRAEPDERRGGDTGSGVRRAMSRRSSPSRP